MSQSAVYQPPVSDTARLLGHLGLLPFVLGAALVWVVNAEAHPYATLALSAFAAVVVSFLGGIHWGLAIDSPSREDNGRFPARIALSVMPSLAGWVALLVPETFGLFILATAVAAMLWVDIWATRAGYAPSWYPKLRIPLTCVVLATLISGAIM